MSHQYDPNRCQMCPAPPQSDYVLCHTCMCRVADWEEMNGCFTCASLTYSERYEYRCSDCVDEPDYDDSEEVPSRRVVNGAASQSGTTAQEKAIVRWYFNP